MRVLLLGGLASHADRLKWLCSSCLRMRKNYRNEFYYGRSFRRLEDGAGPICIRVRVWLSQICMPSWPMIAYSENLNVRVHVQCVTAIMPLVLSAIVEWSTSLERTRAGFCCWSNSGALSALPEPACMHAQNPSCCLVLVLGRRPSALFLFEWVSVE